MNYFTPTGANDEANPEEHCAERLARFLVARQPRRDLQRGVVGLALAALGGGIPAFEARAKKHKKKKKKKHKPRHGKPGQHTPAWRNQTTFGASGSGASQIISPAGLFVTDDGLTAFVADYGKDRISVWTRSSATSADWAKQTTFGTYGSGPSELNTPTDVFVSADGLTAFVADSGFQDNENHRVSVWTRPDATSTAWTNQTTFGTQGSGASQFNSAESVAVSQDGKTAFVADVNNHRISVWTRSSASSSDWANQTTFGTNGSGPNELYAPWGLFGTDDALTVFVAEVQNNRISVWTREDAESTDWSNQTTFGVKGSGRGQLDWPADIFVTADGLTAFVADHYNHRISVWSRDAAESTDWTNQTTFGSQGSGASNFYWPTGVFASKDGRTVFVGDTENGRVSVWTLS